MSLLTTRRNMTHLIINTDDMDQIVMPIERLGLSAMLDQQGHKLFFVNDLAGFIDDDNEVPCWTVTQQEYLRLREILVPREHLPQEQQQALLGSVGAFSSTEISSLPHTQPDTEQNSD